MNHRVLFKVIAKLDYKTSQFVQSAQPDGIKPLVILDPPEKFLVEVDDVGLTKYRKVYIFTEKNYKREHECRKNGKAGIGAMIR